MKMCLIFFAFIMAIATCGTMFIVKYEVVQKEEELYRLNKQIISNQKEIHILKAELAHLTDPKRLRSLAEKYTKLEDIKPFQIISLDDLNFNNNDLKAASYKKGN